MANKAVFGTTRTQAQAETLIRELKAAGFDNQDISILFPDAAGGGALGHEKQTKAPEGAAAGAGAGGALGGTLGLLVGLGALAIPGLGPFIAAGPIMAALSGAAVGAAVGGVTGAIVGLGIPEVVAKQYEGHLRQGNFLVSVHTVDSDELTRAKTIFERCGAENVASSAEASVPDATKTTTNPRY